MFTPVPITEGASFGSFLIMQRHPGSGKLSKKLTKSVGFGDFISDGQDVVVYMEPELTAAEKASIFEGMKNIHPPVPLEAPGMERGGKSDRCDQMVSDMMYEIRSLVKKIPQHSAPARPAEQTYYLRSGKVDQKTCGQIVDFLRSVPDGMLLSVDAFAEWVTDEVGGYRLVMKLNEEAVGRHWRSNEAEFSKKLPRP